MDVSFIIPVYNVERYIAKAIRSVTETDWKDLKYEIVIVDDESPDNSVKVVEDIISKIPSLPITIISQKNKGLGGARNTGLLNAKGRYVFFLDSDDYIISEIFPSLIEKAKTQDLDVLEFAACRVDQNYHIIDHVFLTSTKGRIITGSQYVAEIDFANSACNKLYKTDFLKTKNIIFLEKVYVEDAPFNVEVFSKASKVMAVDDVGAAYLQNASSITRSVRTAAYLHKFINDSILITDRINTLSSSYDNNDAIDRIKTRTAYFLTGILWMVIKGNDLKLVEKRNFINALRNRSLFPYYHKTGSLPRDLFLLFFNVLGSLRLV